jgi:hypothetical protein
MCQCRRRETAVDHFAASVLRRMLRANTIVSTNAEKRILTSPAYANILASAKLNLDSKENIWCKICFGA